uniref:REST corepressor 2 n=1 Tax=Aquila chrysaetos chrysaetos TaxID=223781 RepID=A0A663F2S6_AQUCH
MIRVGADYQAVIPDCKPESPARYSNKELKGMLVWAPNHCVSDAKLDKYIAMAKDKHGYNIEQALGMLLWHKHDVEKSLADLANFTPFPDEWTVEDKVLFEQAFSFHGKSFARIQQMLPDKLIPSLVKYYYSWKKTRTRTSVMDRQARRLLGRKERDDSNDETDDHRPANEGETEPQDPKKEVGGGGEGWGHHARFVSPGIAAAPPRGMHLSREDVAGVTANPDLGALALRQLDCQLVSLKRQVQRIKQINSGLKQALEGGVEGLRPPEVGTGGGGVSPHTPLCPTLPHSIPMCPIASCCAPRCPHVHHGVPASSVVSPISPRTPSHPPVPHSVPWAPQYPHVPHGVPEVSWPCPTVSPCAPLCPCCAPQHQAIP